ncbi:hypothetical protein H1R20_g8653, partial [Candolleomyces eurysporus]
MDAVSPVASQQAFMKETFAGIWTKLWTKKFDFKGKCYFNGTTSTAPNPALTIEGIGLIGLPLPERDAKLIISKALRAPLGDQTVANTQVLDGWEIEPTRVSFRNPKWKQYVDEMASKTICNALGVATGASNPRCELSKLSLYQAGSHFPPHQDTRKVDGVFATIIFILPSAFEGGNIHISHSGTKVFIDVAKNSELNTSVLAWYTDVIQELKPITSGYRLALIYNLIHTSPDVPLPSLPNMQGAVTGLREVLTRWKNGVYKVEQEPPLIAYILSHQYNLVDFGKGSQCLKGSDAHKVAHILPLAEELGFSVCLANLTCTQHGEAEDSMYGCHSRSWFGYGRRRRFSFFDEDDDDFEETPVMAEVREEEYEIKGCVRISRGRKLDLGDFSVSSNAISPEGAFEDADPNGTEGDGAGWVEQWFNRSVLVLFRNEDAIPIAMEIKGASWALQQLDLSSKFPTEEARSVASAALADLKNGRNLTCALPLMDRAVLWEDAQLWNTVCSYFGNTSIETIGQAVEKALEAFGLESIQPGIEGLVKGVAKLQKRIEIIDTVSNLVEDKVDPEWTNALLNVAIFSYTQGSVDDIPNLIWALQKVGLESVQTGIIPKMSKNGGSHQFFVALSKDLHHHREKFASSGRVSNQSTSAQASSAPSVSEVVRQCVSVAVQHWRSVASRREQAHIQPTYPFLYGINAPRSQDPSRIDWIVEMVDLCFTVGEMRPCFDLLKDILLHRGGVDTPEMFKTVYVPLIPKLKSTLEKYGKRMSSEPTIASFLQNLVSVYFVHILGSKSTLPKQLNQAVKCGPHCSDCTQFETWVNDVNAVNDYHLKAAQGRRKHIESRIRAMVLDCLATNTLAIGSPHTLVVSKKKEVWAKYTWSGRQTSAVVFLKAVASSGEAELKELMGERYTDVLKALQGAQMFTPVEGLVGVDITGPDSSDTGAGAMGQRPRVGLNPTIPPLPPSTVGVKRKRSDLSPTDAIVLT